MVEFAHRVMDRIRRRIPEVNQDILSDPELGYRAYLTTYDKREELKLEDGRRFKRGDKVLVLILPSLTDLEGKPLESEDTFANKLKYYVYTAARAHFGAKNYQAVTNYTSIHHGIDAQGNYINRENRWTREAEVRHYQNHPEYLFSPVEYSHRYRRQTAGDIFKLGYEYLQDEQLKSLVIHLRQASSLKEAQGLLQEIQAQLKRGINKELKGKEEPGAVFDPNNPRRRRRVYPSMTLRPDDPTEEELIMDVNDGEGHTRKVPLVKGFRGLEYELDWTELPTILTIDSSKNKLPIRYIMHYMARDLGREIAWVSPTTKEDFLAEMKALALQGPVERKLPTPVVQQKKRSLYRERVIDAAFGLAGLAIGAFIVQQSGLIYDWRGEQLRQVSEISQGDQAVGEMSVHKTAFARRIPIHSLDWKITTNLMSSSGYYTTATANSQNSRGEWEIDRQRERKVEYPTSIPQTDQQLVLENRVALNLLGPTKLKIPLKDHTKMAALELTGSDGKPLTHYSTYLLTDGTVALEIPPLVNLTGWIDIKATLTPTDTESIKPAGVMQSINRALLSKEAEDIVVKAFHEQEEGRSYEESIVAQIRQSHTYSSVPAEEQFFRADIPEEQVNAFIHEKNCSCDTCNSPAAQLLFDKKASLAIGYLYNLPSNPESSKDIGVLDGANSHAYIITEQGILDATPTDSVSDDPITQEYLNRIADPTSDISVEAVWDTQKNKTALTAEKPWQTISSVLMSLGVLALAAGEVLAVREGLNLIKRVDTKKIKKAWDQKVIDCITRNYTSEELSAELAFVQWLSWGDQTRPLRNRSSALEDSEHTRQKLINEIYADMNLDRVTEYLKKPSRFEDLIDLPKHGRCKFRTLIAILRYAI